MFISGYSLRAPSSSNPREFYEALRDGKDMTTPTKRYPPGYLGLPPRTGTISTIDRFDQDFFKFSTKQTEKLDVAIRMLLEVAHEALMDAQLPIEQLKGTKTGVYVGHCFSDFLGRSTCDKSLTGYELVNGAHAMAANKISYFYDFKGPSMAIDTACSSSLVALNQAVSDMKLGVIDRAVVCGLSLTLDPRKNAIFNAFTMVSPDGKCFTFDTRANGYCRSEGVVAIVLESSRVCRGGLCRVLGTSVNSDGFKDKGITFPSGRDQAANALAALAAGDVDPSSIAYVEAHGTGTVAGDKQELDGLSRVFYGDAGTGQEPGGEGNASLAASSGSAFRSIPIGSVKSAMGHAEGASGLMSIAKVLAMYEHEQLLPNQNFERTTHPPLLDGRFRVVTKLEPWKPGNVCISNYGFGGTNAFAVLGPGGDAPSLLSLPLLPNPLGLPALASGSKGSGDGLHLRFSNSASTEFEGVVDQAWLAQQVALGNDKQFKFRNGKKVGPKGGYSKVCFVYGGQGSQWLCMGKKLMAESAEFKATIVRLGVFLKELDQTLDLCAMFEDGSKWLDKRFTVLGIAAYQVAATNLLASAGIVPDYYMGHSLGETAAGYARGLQSEEETIKIAYVRSTLSSKIKPGGFVLKSATPRIPNSNNKNTSDSGSDSGGGGDYPLLCTSQGFYFYDVPAADAAKTVKEGGGDALVVNASLGEELFDNAGQMVAVGLPAAELEAAISELGLRQTCVACFNGPSGQTVSGATSEVAQLKEKLLHMHGKEGLFWREVDTDGVAYHAPHLGCYFDFLVGEFEKILGGQGASRPLDGKWVPTSVNSSSSGVGEGNTVLNATFHARNITNPVYFMQAIQSLPPNTLVVEVGSAQSLLGQVKRVRSDVGLLGLAKRGDVESEGVYLSPENLCGALWEAGFSKAFPGSVAGALKPSRGGWPLSPSPSPTPSLLPTPTVVAAVSGCGQPLARVPFNSRWPDLWDHARQHRVFGYKDFELKFPKEQASSACSDSSSAALGAEDGEEDEDNEGSLSGAASKGHRVVSYDLAGKDAYLLDHQVNGRALFPATGHLYTMWQCASSSSSSSSSASPSDAIKETAEGGERAGGETTALSQGVRFTDFEILTAVVLDLQGSPKVRFFVAQVDGVMTVLHQGSVVARAGFEVLPADFAPSDKPQVPPATLAMAAAATTSTTDAAATSPASSDDDAKKKENKLAWIERGQLYNHFKRYGYEYQTEFQLVTRRTVPIRSSAPSASLSASSSGSDEGNDSGGGHGKGGDVGCGVLRGSEHVIPFLDNFLQLVLEDLHMLQLPTLIRECELLPGLVQEAKDGACVAVETKSSTLASKCVTMRGVHTMPAAGPVHLSLIHDAHVFVGLGVQWRNEPEALKAFEATRAFTANAITHHLKKQPQVLEAKPWLTDVLGHAKQWVVDTEEGPAVDASLYNTSLHYRMHVDLYAEEKVEGLLQHPFLTLSLHPEHDAFYETNHVMASSNAELAGLVGLVRKEWHGCDSLSVFEGGAGSCGFTRRVVPLLGNQLGTYTVSDISAIRLGTLAGHPNIVSVKHDLNQPLPVPQQHHLILANNAIHTASDVARTLRHFRDALVEGGMVLLEEQITDACLYLWGLDSFIWETAFDKRAYGLWMAWDEWQAVIEGCEGMELLCCHRSPYHLTMLLRKKTTTATATDEGAATSVTTAAATTTAAVSSSSWAEIDTSPTSAQVVVGAGAEGLVKTLRLEEGAMGLKVLVDLDGTLEQALVGGVSAAAQPSATTQTPAALVTASMLPLTFNHVQGGKFGSLVAVPLELRDQVQGLGITTSATPSTSGSNEEEKGEAADDDNVQLHIVRPGDLSTLTWIQAPATAEFNVQVAYSSLNFKDVMYAFGKLRLEQPSFGLEFSGTDLSSGGQRVMGIGTSACIAKKAKPTLCWAVPEGMDLEEAATVPVVYATALFALFEKARLRKGQTALIHAGSGGVGHAAIYLCQARGIEVFTTCSDSKRDYVLKTFGLDDAHVGSSRDKSFRETVLVATDGQGVDCVLNSLSGNLLEPSIQCVKPFGHFCEIGKYDLQNNTKVGLKALERNVSYHAIDLATMFDHPHLSVVLKDLVQDALDSKQVVPLPRTSFEATQVEHALRFMSAGKHRGKVLVKMAGFETPLAEASTPRFTTSGTHVITGGLGGFGLELAKWLLEQGARKVVVTGRSGITSGWQKYRAEGILERFGPCALEVSSLDVRDLKECRELLELANNTSSTTTTTNEEESSGIKGGELKGVWHVAMVLQDTLFKNMSDAKWDDVNGVKVQGLENLNNISSELLSDPNNQQLDAFVAFSSVSSLFGNVGQANYSHANAACETLIAKRCARGLKKGSCAVQWGMIDNVGFFGANDAKVLETFLGLQNVDKSLNSLHALVPAGGVVTSYRFASTSTTGGGTGGDNGGGGGGGAPFELSVGVIQAKVAEILGGSGSDYDPDCPLNDYGLDSLSSIEVVNWMSRHTTQTVNPSFMTPDMTITKVNAYMEANLKVAF